MILIVSHPNKELIENRSKDDSDIHWSELHPMIITRKELVIFKLNNRICVVAGRGPEDEEHSSC